MNLKQVNLENLKITGKVLLTDPRPKQAVGIETQRERFKTFEVEGDQQRAEKNQQKQQCARQKCFERRNR